MKIYDDNRYCVYVHINKINGKAYVGQSVNIEERWRSNGKNYEGCPKFYRAIKKYGWDNFEHILIEQNLLREEADQKEKEFIEKYNSIKAGYNLKEGGLQGRLSEQSLIKMGRSVSKGFKEHPERIEKIRQKAIGRKVSQDTKTKMMLNSRKTIVIDIDGEIGSIRYWAKKLNMNHAPLLYKNNNYGIDYLIKYIKLKLKNDSSVSRYKKVYKFDMNTRKLISEYQSIVDAAKDINVSPTCIISAAKGKYHSSGGYFWSYFPVLEEYKK